MSSALKLLAGLGNPGPNYALTRHNAGFWFVDAVARRYGGDFRSDKRFFGDVCEVSIGLHRLRLLKPTTFMNHSGRAVAAAANYFRVEPAEILVAHDEIDLPPGTVRLKVGGGHGGHNGLRDVIPQVGDPGFARLRIGVGHPGRADQVVGYVLQRAPAAEQALIEESVARALDVAPEMAAGDFAPVMNVLHRKRPGDDQDDPGAPDAK